MQLKCQSMQPSAMPLVSTAVLHKMSLSQLQQALRGYQQAVGDVARRRLLPLPQRQQCVQLSCRRPAQIKMQLLVMPEAQRDGAALQLLVSERNSHARTERQPVQQPLQIMLSRACLAAEGAAD